MDYVVKNIGSNRGQPRLFLDGQQAVRAGFSPGDRYEVTIDGDRLTLEARDDGSRVVSKRDRAGHTLPVIDLNSAKLLALFEGMDSVRMIVTPGKVIFLPLASEKAKKERLTRLSKKLAAGEPLMSGSVSHGGGVLAHALHQGLHKAGIESNLAFANEIREDLIALAQRNNSVWGKDSMALIAPMQELVQDEWMMNRLPRVEILELGLPCQGASPAGKAKNAIAKMEDHPEVGHLVFSALAILAKTQPAVVLLENVPAYAQTASAQILRYQLADMGYITHESILTGKDFGCMENRVRWCMVAVTKGLDFDFADITPHVASSTPLGDLLDTNIADNDPRWQSFGYLRDKEVRDKAAGKGFRMQVVDKDATSVPTLRKGYNKGGSTDPYLAHPTLPDVMRKFTGAEHARIKGVPVELIEAMSETMAHELLGQGIVYAPFQQVGLGIGESIVRLREQTMGGSGKQPTQTKMLAYADLPEDMQVLLMQFVEDRGHTWPRGIEEIPVPVQSVDIALLADAALQSEAATFDNRGAEHIQAFVQSYQAGDAVPPIVLENGLAIDGRHRLIAASLAGLKTIDAIPFDNYVTRVKAINMQPLLAAVKETPAKKRAITKSVDRTLE